jgi:hypothetical protein
MEFINVRQLLRDIDGATKKLPVTVTRYGKPIFLIEEANKVELVVDMPDVPSEVQSKTITGCDHVIRYTSWGAVACGEPIYKEGKCKKHYDQG